MNNSTTSFDVTSGNKTTGLISGVGNTTVSAGATLTASAIQQNTLTVNGKVAIVPQSGTRDDAATVSVVSGLNLAVSNNTWSGLVDLGNNDLIVHGGGSSGLANITNQIKQGYNSGTWTGTGGITSSTAAAAAQTGNDVMGLGVELNDNGAGTPLMTTFDGQTVADGDVLVKYTYFGDANLDGTVNGSDYTLIDNGYNSQGSAHPLSGWRNGDFNYDGVINGDDYILIDNAFNTIGAGSLAPLDTATLPQEMIASDTEQLATPTIAVAAVPEPGSLYLLSLASIGILGRRRRKNCNANRKTSTACPIRTSPKSEMLNR